jgi:tetratricopeptide (TPR) repeat protein
MATTFVGRTLGICTLLILSTVAGLDPPSAWAQKQNALQKAQQGKAERQHSEANRPGVTLEDMAAAYERQGRYAEAIPLRERALAIKEKALGPDHPDVASALTDLGAVYRAQGQYAEAIPLFERAIAIYEKALGHEHPRLARPLNNLAIVSSVQGRYAEAIALYERHKASMPRRLRFTSGRSPSGKRCTAAKTVW